MIDSENLYNGIDFMGPENLAIKSRDDLIEKLQLAENDISLGKVYSVNEVFPHQNKE